MGEVSSLRISLGVFVGLCLAIGGCSEVTPRRAADARVDAPGLDASARDASRDDATIDASDVPDVSAASDAPVSPDAVSLDAGPICPPPGGIDCSPGTGTGEGDQCYAATSCFLSEVQRAVNDVVRDHPEWFDASAGPTHVLQVEMYMDAVVALLNARDLCAIRDPNAGDEVVVKLNNAYSENFDILTASEDVRSGAGIFTSQCAPAWF